MCDIIMINYPGKATSVFCLALGGGGGYLILDVYTPGPKKRQWKWGVASLTKFWNWQFYKKHKNKKVDFNDKEENIVFTSN